MTWELGQPCVSDDGGCNEREDTLGATSSRHRHWTILATLRT